MEARHGKRKRLYADSGICGMIQGMSPEVIHVTAEQIERVEIMLDVDEGRRLTAEYVRSPSKQENIN